MYCNLAGSVHWSVYDFTKPQNTGANKEFLIKLLNNFMEWIFIAILSGGSAPPCQKVERLKLHTEAADQQSLTTTFLVRHNVCLFLLCVMNLSTVHYPNDFPHDYFGIKEIVMPHLKLSKNRLTCVLR